MMPLLAAIASLLASHWLAAPAGPVEVGPLRIDVAAVQSVLPARLWDDADAVGRARAEWADHALAIEALGRRQRGQVAAAARADERRAMRDFADDTAWRDHLAARGQTRAGWRLVRATERAIDLQVAVPPVDTARAAERFRQRWGRYVVPERVDLGEIAAPLPDSAGTDAAIARLAAAEKSLAGGASFRAVARAHSAAPTARSGGRRGWTTLDALDPALQAAIRPLQPGQTSGIVRSAWGAHIVHLVARQPARKPAFAEVQPLVSSQLREEDLALARHHWLAGARARYLAGRAAVVR